MEFVVGNFNSEIDAGWVLGTPGDPALSGKITGFRDACSDIFQLVKSNDFSEFPFAKVPIYFEIRNLFGDVLFITLRNRCEMCREEYQRDCYYH